MTASRVIRIVVADPQQIFRDGLKGLLESDPQFVVVGGAATAAQTMQMVHQHDPDVLLLDLAIPEGGGLAVLKTLAAARKQVRTIALTASVEEDQMLVALRYGARGVIPKESTTELLFRSIRTVFDDERASRAAD